MKRDDHDYRRSISGKTCLCKGDVSGCALDRRRTEAIFQYRGIFHFHKYIERLLSEGEDISELAKQLKEKNPDLILVTDEIGYGIVPMDPFLREVRETTGRICTELAKDAKSVIRVVCGIPTVIKAQVK